MKPERDWSGWVSAASIDFRDQEYITKSFVDGRPVPLHKPYTIDQPWFSIKVWGTRGYK